ncbi:MAG TPA: BamA/TamA family outer membrane protein, partial [Flavisolibacter sp.]|nr:BamA/TamA family outer membrane protein [Flavisolibacter sp.]
IDKVNDGKVHVVVNKIDKANNISSKIYDRVFDPIVTKELQLYGLEGRDSFVVKGGNSPIKVRIIGGPGNDHFVNQGTDVNVLVYDVTFEDNQFIGDETGFKKKLSPDPRVNAYNRLFYKYGYFHPGVSFAYNVDDGLFLGLKSEGITHGFRKEPYEMRQYLNVNHALRTSSYRFRYEADYIKPFGLSDILVRADVRAPINVTNFFGYGNNTVFDKNAGRGAEYYRTRYDIANLSVLLRRQLQSWMRVHYGAAMQYFRIEKEHNIGKFVSNTQNNGLDSTSLYNGKWYAGAAFLMDINSRNNQVLPTRGFKLDAGARSLFGLNQLSQNVTQLHWDMNVIASFTPLSKMVYALRFGVGHNIGKFEMPQAQYLSGTENLRGYRRNRFAGRTVVYQNTELRYKLADFTTYFFPGAIGIQVFNDVGRVWMDSEASKKWHVGYGAGIWVSPIKRLVVTGSVANSKEEKLLPYFTFGFQF